MTRTYLVLDGTELVAYVSVLCDAIRLTQKERPTNHPDAPALKIGLMGVRSDYRKREYEGRTIGCWILDWVVGLARSLAKQVGLRYVTLDSLAREKLVAWYSDYGFKKNMAEERARKILRQAGKADLKDKKLEEIELPQVSMRFDIRLKEEGTP